jgi:3-oxoacyl-[acyl-carrier protein] reductase
MAFALNHADYAVTKGELISLTKSLSTALTPRGIRVNRAARGWVATDMSKAALANPASSYWPLATGYRLTQGGR